MAKTYGNKELTPGDILPPPGVKESEDNNLPIDVSRISVVIPVNANLKKYDLLIIHWQSYFEEYSLTSYPLPVTSDLVGKEYEYIINGDVVSKNHDSLIRVWYTVQQSGGERVNISRTFDLFISSRPPKIEDFNRLPETVIAPSQRVDTGRLLIENHSQCNGVSITNSASPDKGMVLQVINTERKNGTVELSFRKPLSHVKLLVSSSSYSINGGYIVALASDGMTATSPPYTISNITEEIEFTRNSYAMIHTCRIIFTQDLEMITFDNISMEYE